MIHCAAFVERWDSLSIGRTKPMSALKAFGAIAFADFNFSTAFSLLTV
jgi:hypothetical protein